MTSAEFTAKYRILKTLTEDGARSQIAQETALGRMVMVHSLDVGTTGERASLLTKARSLDPSGAAKVFEIVEVDGTHVVVTHFLTSFTNLSTWVAQHAAPGQPLPAAPHDDIQTAATQIIQAQVPRAAATPPTLPPKPAATQPPARTPEPAQSSGESFTKVFSGVAQKSAPTPAPTAAVPPPMTATSPTPPTPSLAQPHTSPRAAPPPGEFTRVFQGIATPARPADSMSARPAAAPPPPAVPPAVPPPAAKPPSSPPPAASLPAPTLPPPTPSFSSTVVPGKGAATPPPATPPPLPPPAARQPSFAPPPTFAPRPAAPPPATLPPNPSASPAPAGGESFTGVFGKLSAPPPPIAPPSQPPKQSLSLPSLSPGAARFDSVMPPVDSSPLQMSAPVAPLPKTPASPAGDFTELFSRLETPGSIPVVPPPGSLSGSPGMPGSPSTLPPPKPIGPVGGRPGAGGPSEFTRILGQVSPPPGGPPPRPAPLKPPAAPAPAPAPAPAVLTKAVKSYLPLIIALNVVVLLAVVVILFFVFKK